MKETSVPMASTQEIEALLAWLLSSENLELAQLARRVGWATAAWCEGCSWLLLNESLSEQ